MAQHPVFDGRLRVDYHQAYFLTGDVDLMFADPFGGQCNGLLGAALSGALVLRTGTALGDVTLRLVLHDEAPPVGHRWEDVVEASFAPAGQAARLVTWDGQELCSVELPGPSYRVRWSGYGMDENYDGHVEAEREETDNVFELALWPSPMTADAVLRQDSERGRQSHPAWYASAQGAAGLREKWGADPPGEALRKRPRAWSVIQLDRRLAEDLAAASAARQRAVTAWALRQACAWTRLDRLEWVPGLLHEQVTA